MTLLMKNVKTWCYENRQALHEWLTLQPFQRLMNLVAAATWGMNGGDDWSEQIAFLKSPEGRAYAEKVEVTLIEQVKRGYRDQPSGRDREVCVARAPPAAAAANAEASLCQNCVRCPPKPRSNTVSYGRRSKNFVVGLSR